MHEEHLLSSWLREDVEGKTAEMEKANREAKEEESKSGKRQVEGGGKRIKVNSRRVCSDRVSIIVLNVLKFTPIRRWVRTFDGVSWM